MRPIERGFNGWNGRTTPVRFAWSAWGSRQTGGNRMPGLARCQCEGNCGDHLTQNGFAQSENSLRIGKRRRVGLHLVRSLADCYRRQFHKIGASERPRVGILCCSSAHNSYCRLRQCRDRGCGIHTHRKCYLGFQLIIRSSADFYSDLCTCGNENIGCVIFRSVEDGP